MALLYLKHFICEAQVPSKLSHKSSVCLHKMLIHWLTVCCNMRCINEKTCKKWEPYTYRTLVSYLLGKAERGDQSKVAKGRREASRDLFCRGSLTWREDTKTNTHQQTLSLQLFRSSVNDPRNLHAGISNFLILIFITQRKALYL